MNICYLLLLLFIKQLNAVKVPNKSIIENINVPSCRNCIYYKPSVFGDEFSSTFSRCEKFGEKNIITNEIRYDYAESCRNNELKCGKEGKYFEEETSINRKIIKNFIIKNSKYIIILSPAFLVILLQIITLDKK